MNTIESVKDDIRNLGISEGDIVLFKTGLSLFMSGATRITPSQFIEALLEIVGESGTIVTCAFTVGSFIFKPKDTSKAFTNLSRSYAGPIPNLMIHMPQAKRSQHPTNSFVAIGKDAEFIVANHTPQSGAYDPIKNIMLLNGKSLIVGCVDSNPGFITTHLCETDLGLTRRVMMPWLSSTYYLDEHGAAKLYRRPDSGFCSLGQWKFYSYYVNAGILKAGLINNIYSISAKTKQSYEIEKKILSKNPQFHVCGSSLCISCNAMRWDRLHRIPIFLLSRFARKLSRIYRSFKV